MNTASEPLRSNYGLLTTLAYKAGAKPAQYALEGSIAITRALGQWMRNNLGLIEKSADIETLGRTVDDNGGIYFVPASGLYAPYWKTSARGVIIGLTRYANKGHLALAALEATVFQTREVVEAVERDAKIQLEVLRADGGMVDNDLGRVGNECENATLGIRGIVLIRLVLGRDFDSPSLDSLETLRLRMNRIRKAPNPGIALESGQCHVNN
jgi:glycerol kinase